MFPQKIVCVCFFSLCAVHKPRAFTQSHNHQRRSNTRNTTGAQNTHRLRNVVVVVWCGCWCAVPNTWRRGELDKRKTAIQHVRTINGSERRTSEVEGNLFTGMHILEYVFIFVCMCSLEPMTRHTNRFGCACSIMRSCGESFRTHR